MEFLSQYNIKIKYRPGKAGGKPDALTRRSVDLTKGRNERLKFQNQVVLKPENLDLLTTNISRASPPLECYQMEDGPRAEELEVEWSEIEGLLQKAYNEDDWVRDIMKVVRIG